MVELKYNMTCGDVLLQSEYKQHLDACMVQLDETRRQAAAELESERRRQHDLWVSADLMEALAAQSCQDALDMIDTKVCEGRTACQLKMQQYEADLSTMLRQLQDTHSQLEEERQSYALHIVALEQLQNDVNNLKREHEKREADLEDLVAQERKARLNAEDRIRDLDSTIRECKAAAAANVRHLLCVPLCCIHVCLCVWPCTALEYPG